ncbi:hypothetical protein D3C86_1912980 [compost metagenome]
MRFRLPVSVFSEDTGLAAPVALIWIAEPIADTVMPGPCVIVSAPVRVFSEATPAVPPPPVLLMVMVLVPVSLSSVTLVPAARVTPSVKSVPVTRR